MADNVNHPAHYVKEGRKECIVEMEEKFGPLAVYWFSVLSAYKYRYRDGDKPGNSAEQDEAKAEWFDQEAKEMAIKLSERFFEICFLGSINEAEMQMKAMYGDGYRTGKEVAEQFLERCANHDK